MRNLLLIPALLVVCLAACVLRIFAHRHPAEFRQKGEGPADLPRAA